MGPGQLVVAKALANHALLKVHHHIRHCLSEPSLDEMIDLYVQVIRQEIAECPKLQVLIPMFWKK